MVVGIPGAGRGCLSGTVQHAVRGSVLKVIGMHGQIAMGIVSYRMGALKWACRRLWCTCTLACSPDLDGECSMNACNYMVIHMMVPGWVDTIS